MSSTSEGTRRLSLFVGGIGSLVGFVFILGLSSGSKGLSGAEWLFIGAILLASFFAPFGFVRGVAWVIHGFREKK